MIGELDKSLKGIVVPFILATENPVFSHNVQLPGSDEADIPESRIIGQVREYAGDFHLELVTEGENLADGRLAAEDCFGCGGGKQNRVRVLQSVKVSFAHLEHEHFWRIHVHENAIANVIIGSRAEDIFARERGHYHIPEVIPIFDLQLFSHRERHGGKGADLAI